MGGFLSPSYLDLVGRSEGAQREGCCHHCVLVGVVTGSMGNEATALGTHGMGLVRVLVLSVVGVRFVT